VIVVFPGGERYPMLVDRMDIPLFNPTIWSFTRFRSKSSNTMEQALRSVMLIYFFCFRRGIDLADRIWDGSFFSAVELDALFDEAVTRFADIASRPALADHLGPAPMARRNTNVARFLRAPKKAKKKKTVAPETTRIRIHYIKDYLQWISEDRRHRMPTKTAEDLQRLELHRDTLASLLEGIEQRLPGAANDEGTRESLEPDQIALLLRVTDPDSGDNPWTSPFVRLRNWVIVRWLLATGARRGELLSLWVKDFNTREGWFEIVRRFYGKIDPRKRAPRIKTKERLAPLDEELTELGERYLAERRKIVAARKHPFLFVADDGAPMSESAITDLFATLRAKHPRLAPVTAHVLRHQWNEIFSTYCDKNGIPPEQELDERRFLMGWSRISKMPGYYLKRKNRRRANEHLLDMQRGLMRHGSEIKRRIDEMVAAESSLQGDMGYLRELT
jgi:integrase